MEFIEGVEGHDEVALEPGLVLDEMCNVSLGRFSVNDMRLAAFFKLVRHLERKEVNAFVDDILDEARGQSAERHVQGIVDIFLLAFQTRDIQEGKGERLLFYYMLIRLHELFPQTTTKMLWLIPEVYGSWKDLLLLLEICVDDRRRAILAAASRVEEHQAYLETQETETETKTKKGQRTRRQRKGVKLGHPSERPKLFFAEGMKGPAGKSDITRVIVDMFASQLVTDEERAARKTVLANKLDKATSDMEKDLIREQMKEQDSVPSLCAKWAPREGKRYGPLARAIALKMDESRIAAASAGDEATQASARNAAYASYRRRVSALNKGLRTLEVTMCARNPDGTSQWASIDPASIPARCLNLNRRAFFNTKVKVDMDQENVRYDTEDRVKCGEKFKEHMEKAAQPGSSTKVHGANMQPHELVKVYYDDTPQEDDLTIEAQWTDLREKLVEASGDEGGLSKFIALSDVSGSMAGIPMIVSIAMGILISELTCPAFANQFITFSETPTWHQLPTEKGGCSLRHKVYSARDADWGGSTCFYQAMDLVIARCREFKMTATQVSELRIAVFSDMQFSDSDNGADWKSKHEMIKARWASQGFVDATTGEGVCPRIIYWNLRPDTPDFPSNADTPGVDMVSGFSAQMLKMFMTGGDMSSSPYLGMRQVLDAERYDAVREVCVGASELVVAGVSYAGMSRKAGEE